MSTLIDMDLVLKNIWMKIIFIQKVVKEELDKYKTENANLQGAIEILENNKNLLEEEIKKVKSSIR